MVAVITDDDVAVQDSLYTAGRRGTGATVFVEKIAGALAEQQRELKSVADVAREVASLPVEPVLSDLPFEKGDPVIAFVNGLGGTPLIELYLMFNEVQKILDQHGVPVARSLVGSYITSLDMAGVSVTLLRVDDELLSLWDAPVNTPALRWGI